jgi:uncharacterized membrane protein
VLFHFMVIAVMFDFSEVDLFHGFWNVLAEFVRWIFLGLVGVSTVLSRRTYVGHLKRAGKVALAAALVSLATWVLYGDDFVRFGILHLIAVSIPVVALFKGRPAFAVLAAGLCLLLWAPFDGSALDTFLTSPWDTFQIFPRLSIPLMGLVLGELLYAKRQPTFMAQLTRVPGLVWLGQRSLMIYLLHLPILYIMFLWLSNLV